MRLPGFAAEASCGSGYRPHFSMRMHNEAWLDQDIVIAALFQEGSNGCSYYPCGTCGEGALLYCLDTVISDASACVDSYCMGASPALTGADNVTAIKWRPPTGPWVRCGQCWCRGNVMDCRNAPRPRPTKRT